MTNPKSKELRASRLLALLTAAMACHSSACDTPTRSQQLVGVSSAAVGPAEPPSPPLPEDPQVRREVLESGVTLLWNRHGTSSGLFRLLLVVKAGKLSEAPGEEGFAHLIEHLAARRAMRQDSSMRRAGVALGDGFGAWTKSDHTYYSFLLPGKEPGTAKQAIAMMHQWASALPFQADEVASEQAIVLAEGREHGERDDFALPAYRLLLSGSAYAQRAARPSTLSVAPVAPEGLAAFYRRWYHPDNIAVVVVGSFDEDPVLHQIRSAFGALPRSSGGAKLSPATIPVEPGLRVSSLQAPGTSPGLQIVMKLPARPQIDASSLRAFMLDSVISAILQRRLGSLAEAADSPLTTSGNRRLLPLVGRLASVRVGAGVRDFRFEQAAEMALRELRRLELHPPEESELQATQSMFSSVLASSPTTSTVEKNAARLLRAFVTGAPTTSWPAERELKLRLVSELSVEELGRRIALWFEKGERHLVLLAPEGVELPGEEKLAAIVTTVSSERPEASAAPTALKELLESRPASGGIGEPEELSALGAFRWKLDNGAVVLFKPTASPGLEMQAFSPGGWVAADDYDATTVRLAPAAVAAAGLGNHRALAVERFLFARGVRLEPWLGPHEEGIVGRAGEGQAETLLQALYLMVRDPGRDRIAFERHREQLLSSSASAEALQAAIDAQVWPANRHFAPLSEADLSKLDFETARRLFSQRFGNVSDFTFVFAGDLDPAALQSLLGSYLASLPGAPRQEASREPFAHRRPGITKVRVDAPGRQTSRVRLDFHGRSRLGSRDRMLLHVLGLVLQDMLNDELRVRSAATYGVQTSVHVEPPPLGEYTLSVAFECEPARAEELQAQALSVVTGLRRQGPREADLQAVQQLWKRIEADPVDRFWLDEIAAAERHGEDPDRIGFVWSGLASLSREQLHAFARRILDPKQLVDAVQVGGRVR